LYRPIDASTFERLLYGIMAHPHQEPG